MDMEIPSIHEPLMVVRIDVSMERYSVVEDVVYYRAKMPMNLALRWRWFFEYIAARVKVKHPRRKVRLSIKQQSEEFKVGADYIAEKRTTLLRAKHAQIKKLQNQTANDLFGFAEDDRLSKINKLQGEIAALERGEFNYWFPVEYKNHIKQWI